MPYNSAAYLREAGGPGELEKHVAEVRRSGITTVIVGMLHIGDPDMKHIGDPARDKTMVLGDSSTTTIGRL